MQGRWTVITGELLYTTPGVTVMTVGDQVTVRNSDTRATLRLAPRDTAAFVAVLRALARPRTAWDAAALLADITGSDPASARAEIEGLLRLGVLRTAPAGSELGAARKQDFEDDTAWDAHGWGEAFRYHRHTRLLPVVDWSDDEAVRLDVQMMRDYLAVADPPAPYLDREACERVSAPPPEEHPRVRAIEDTLTGPPGTPLDRDDLLTVLALTFGSTGHRRLPVTGAHLTKTSPSGGSRHPVEAFVALLRPVGELEPGLFHWSVRANALDRLDTADHEEAVRRHVILLPDRPRFAPVAAVVLAAVCERGMYRYRESRSYRVLYLDAGHLLQTFAYTASALGRPTYRGYTLHEEPVTAMFGLEPLHHLPLAFGILG
ncbi:hypothetical protein [Streptomyces sp. NBC_00233]|uniref:hypothetical protein n=1 Tax=Streptomyces sp. NBC_00233 TaxID=2975686 RepID=UPI0022593D85|nr:hypothetical protein [Streptomyces sp. NBC_00233]MCX5232604.1 hypothetical protein [Streptomyces sp. NBC_00233]